VDAEDEAQLLRLVKNGLRTREISQKINRTVAAIDGRLKTIKARGGTNL
jgi:DNA-binding CsgD family transcriptional regulator